ncbi:MAG: peptidoglycan-binding domain-containing protein [Candidatus Anstonellales archaeon]
MPEPALEKALEKVGGMPSTTRSAVQGLIYSIAKMRGTKIGTLDISEAIKKGGKWEEAAWNQIKYQLQRETKVYVDGKWVMMNEETLDALISYLRGKELREYVIKLLEPSNKDWPSIAKSFEGSLTKSLKSQGFTDDVIKVMLGQTPKGEIKALPPGEAPKYVGNLEKLGKYSAIGILVIGALLVGGSIIYAITKGGVKKTEEKPTREQMAEALGWKPSPYPPGYGGEPIPAPGISPEMLKEEKPKKAEAGAKPSAKPTVGKAVSKTEIEELEGKTTEELWNMITLQYDVPGKYKGYSYMGGANGLRSGRDVAIVQILANRLFGANLLVNGVYDAETMAAVKALQGRVGVTQDGYFGIDTKTALGEYLKMRAPPKEEEGEGGAPPGEKPVAPTPGEAVLGRFVFTREIDRDYVKPPKGPTQLMDENFYVKTDSGWLTAKELVRKDLNEIDKNWETDKATAATVASKENWNTRTLTRKNIGVFSWANTKKVLFPYLYASGQMVEFRTWEPLEIKNEEGEVVLRVAAGQVVQGVIREYDEGGKDGSITMEVTAVLDDFTVNGGKPIKPSGEETKPSPAVAAIPTPTVAEGEEVSDLPPPAAERDYS